MENEFEQQHLDEDDTTCDSTVTSSTSTLSVSEMSRQRKTAMPSWFNQYRIPRVSSTSSATTTPAAPPVVVSNPPGPTLVPRPRQTVRIRGPNVSQFSPSSTSFLRLTSPGPITMATTRFSSPPPAPTPILEKFGATMHGMGTTVGLPMGTRLMLQPPPRQAQATSQQPGRLNFTLTSRPVMQTQQRAAAVVARPQNIVFRPAVSTVHQNNTVFIVPSPHSTPTPSPVKQNIMLASPSSAPVRQQQLIRSPSLQQHQQQQHVIMTSDKPSYILLPTSDRQSFILAPASSVSTAPTTSATPPRVVVPFRSSSAAATIVSGLRQIRHQSAIVRPVVHSPPPPSNPIPILEKFALQLNAAAAASRGASPASGMTRFELVTRQPDRLQQPPRQQAIIGAVNSSNSIFSRNQIRLISNAGVMTRSPSPALTQFVLRQPTVSRPAPVINTSQMSTVIIVESRPPPTSSNNNST